MNTIIYNSSMLTYMYAGSYSLILISNSYFYEGSLHLWLDLKKPGFHTHKIKLMILTEMDYWLYHIPLWALLRNREYGFCGSLSPRPCVSALMPLAGRGYLEMVFRGLQASKEWW